MSTNSRFPSTMGRKRQYGVSILELMIAMAIGLLIVATIGYAYLGAKNSFRSQNAAALIQENARYAFTIIAADVRLAGFVGGDATSGVNAVNTPTWDPNLKDLFSLPLIGYEDGVSTFPTGVPSTHIGDALTSVHADTENAFRIASQDTTANTFTLNSWPTSNPPEAGEIMVAADPTNAAVFQATAVDSTALTVAYATGVGTPGNSTTALGTFNAISSGTLSPLSAVTYFVKTNSAGEPALYRLRLTHSGATATTVTEELIEGVENMQIKYGVDLSATADNSVDAYWTADSVTNGTDGSNSMPISAATTSQRWARVLSVRITLDMVSPKTSKVSNVGDGLMRRSFTTTLAIRNRLL